MEASGLGMDIRDGGHNNDPTRESVTGTPDPTQEEETCGPIRKSKQEATWRFQLASGRSLE